MRPPITSIGVCILAYTRPMQFNEIKIIMKISKIIRVVRFLTYFGKTIVTKKNINVTTITCVEGKDGSPEPFGRVATINILSNITHVIAANARGRGIQRICLSTFLRDFLETHWYSPKQTKIAKVIIDIISIMLVIKSHCIIVLL